MQAIVLNAGNQPPRKEPSGVFSLSQRDEVRAEFQDGYDVEQVVFLLRRVEGQSLPAALEIGKILFATVFASDDSLLRARGRKCSSFRKLASHPDLQMSTSSLWRAVAIYELSLRFPELGRYNNVGVGHISVVLGLPQADQFVLLREAESKRWTRRKLQKMASEIRLRQREPGMIPCARVVESLAGLELLVRDAALDRQFGLMTYMEANQALHTLQRIQQRVGEVEGRLKAAAGYAL